MMYAKSIHIVRHLLFVNMTLLPCAIFNLLCSLKILGAR